MSRVGSKRAKGIATKSERSLRRKSFLNEEHGSLETRIVSLAKDGKLKQAGSRAVSFQLKAGLPVVYQSGDRIVREHPDGTTETMRTVNEAFEPVPARFKSFLVPKKRR